MCINIIRMHPSTEITFGGIGSASGHASGFPCQREYDNARCFFGGDELLCCGPDNNVMVNILDSNLNLDI